MSKERIKDEQARQYMVLAKIKGEVNELQKVVNNTINVWGECVVKGELVADRMFDLILSFANDISETIKEYLASKPEII